MAMPIVKSERWPVRSGEDIVRVRQIVRRWAVELGCGLVDQTKIVPAARQSARFVDAMETTMTTVSVPMSQPSQPGEARRAAMRLPSGAGLDEEVVGKVAIAVTEAASNVVKHGRGGDVILRTLRDGEAHGLEMLALDRGSGMANVGECFRDGYSTAGTAGTGLGAIRRLSSEFDVHTIPGVGTAVLARFWSAAPPKPE